MNRPKGEMITTKGDAGGGLPTKARKEGRPESNRPPIIDADMELDNRSFTGLKWLEIVPLVYIGSTRNKKELSITA